jgi:hypothetical protein
MSTNFLRRPARRRGRNPHKPFLIKTAFAVSQTQRRCQAARAPNSGQAAHARAAARAAPSEFSFRAPKT